MNALEEMFEKQSSAADYAKSYAAYIGTLVNALDFDSISTFVDILMKARQERKTIFFIGNGGSAATASHFANDLAIGTRCPELPFKVMSLTDNVPVLTAIGNDFGYEDLFLKQLEVFMQAGDVLVSISASGNSPNVIKAVEYAHKLGNMTVGLTGFSGGKLREICKHTIHVQTEKGEYGPVEDIHMFLDHLIMTYISQRIRTQM